MENRNTIRREGENKDEIPRNLCQTSFNQFRFDMGFLNLKKVFGQFYERFFVVVCRGLYSNLKILEDRIRDYILLYDDRCV